jgi:hypothetical protein
VKPLPALRQIWPAAQGRPSVPQVHAVPEHALAVMGSHAFPHVPQFMKLRSERPSVPEGTLRFTHVVPQQRCVEGHEGEHAPGGPRSMLGTEPSFIGMPLTHDPTRQSWPGAQRIPHPPQLFASVATGTHTPSHERSNDDAHGGVVIRSSVHAPKAAAMQTVARTRTRERTKDG